MVLHYSEEVFRSLGSTFYIRLSGNPITSIVGITTSVTTASTAAGVTLTARSTKGALDLEYGVETVRHGGNSVREVSHMGDV